MKPSILADFYRQYDNNKLPKPEIALNVLQKKGIPAERLKSAWEILESNAARTNMIRVIGGSDYIFLDRNGNAINAIEAPSSSDKDMVNEQSEDINASFDVPSEVLQRMNITPPISETLPVVSKKEKPNIFISHGKNNATIVGQLKELLLYGQMEPIVSVERETTAIPVPDKVFDDMRNCDAGIIHIDLEEVPYGDGAQKYSRLNENVLIEIGAAIALYGKRVILLCKKGTVLPSNLQGLYRCEYEGHQLDYAATMKLLKTMQELREMM